MRQRLDVPLRACGIPVALAAMLLAASAGPAGAQDVCPRENNGWVECATPWEPPPAELWGELEPSDGAALSQRGRERRDSTEFQDFDGPESTVPWFLSLDVENGFVFIAGGYRLQIWSPGTPALPGAPVAMTLLGEVKGSGSSLDSFPFLHQDEVSTPVRDLDAPSGNGNAVALVGVAGMGLSIVDTTDKNSPRVLYQHSGRDMEEVYTARINDDDYAFAGQLTGDTNAGLFVYDMSRALGGSRCHAPLQSCPGILRGRIGTRPAEYVDGTGIYVVTSAGTGRGYQLWSVPDPSQPASAVLELAGLTGQPVYGVALWEEGGTHYLGLATSVGRDYFGQVYDVSCITGTCATAPPLLASFPVRQGAPAVYVTFSRSGGREFLHFGTNDMAGPRSFDREFLVDVSNPASPRQVAPPGYFSWTERWNGVWPGRGKVHGQHFYRAAHTVLDTHRLVPVVPPVPDFAASPAVIYPGTPVQFEDRSEGRPTGWTWTAEDGQAPPP